ncbi:MAG TPA: hypothetical protein VMH23_18530, partial [Bacteroidota bacterium]|nr:hypothetical protein [Bacteroidota bacterium]
MNSRFVTVLILIALISLDSHAQWTSAQGPYGGIVRRLVTSGQDLLASLDTGGVFQSSNNGSTWAAVNTGLTNHSVWSLCVNGA